jgi:hypothetical protein
MRQEFNDAYGINVSGTHVLNYSLCPLLFLLQSQSARLIFLTSGAGGHHRKGCD